MLCILRQYVLPFDVARTSVRKGSVAALQACAYSRNPRGSMCQSHALPDDDDDVIAVVADADCPLFVLVLCADLV